MTLLHLAFLGSSFEEALPHLLQQQKQQQVMHPANGIHSINNRPITTQAAKPPNTATSCENKKSSILLHTATGIYSINNSSITTQAVQPPNTATSCENKKK